MRDADQAKFPATTLYSTLSATLAAFTLSLVSAPCKSTDGSVPRPARAALAQLADPAGYRACTWDLLQDVFGRDYWRQSFHRYADRVGILIRGQYPDVGAARIAEFAAALRELIDRLLLTPDPGQPLDVYTIVAAEQALLAAWGFDDPYQDIKVRENHAALALLPRLLADLDIMPDDRQFEMIVSGLLAGNRFDLGAEVTAREFFNGDADFFRWRAAQPARPWLVDDVDAWRRRWRVGGGAYRHVLFFVDNAGADFVLGCLPLMRWMLRHGPRVTLAANSRPALNDITAGELVELLASVADFDDEIARAMADARLDVLETGSGTSLIDLSNLLPAFVQQSRGADLLILHGMGRALESNYDARFTCDALWTATIKDELVAKRQGGKMFDCVFRFQASAPELAPMRPKQ